MNFRPNETYSNPSFNSAISNGSLMNPSNLNGLNPNQFNLQQFHPNDFSQMNQLGQGSTNSQTENKNLPNEQTCPTYDKSVNYYHEFWRMYLQNEVLISSMKDHVVKTKELQSRIATLEAQCHEYELNLLSSMKKENLKKKRSKATEIEKSYTCPYESCEKSYGSDVALNLHIKLKHGGGNKTEREKLAKMIIEAKLRKEDGPEINLNLPPGFFENIDLDKISKLKERKSSADQASLKKLLSDNNINENDLADLLNNLKNQNSEDQVVKKFKADPSSKTKKTAKEGQASDEHEAQDSPEMTPNDKSVNSTNS